MLEFKAIGKEFRRTPADPPVRAIDDISFTLGANEFVSVVGPSGCGKTTLLRMVARMIEPSSGSLHFFNGEEHATTGFVFQNASLFPWRTVADNVGYGLELARHRQSPPLTRRVKRANGSASCSRWWGSMSSRASTPPKFRAACSSAATSPARSPFGRSCC